MPAAALRTILVPLKKFEAQGLEPPQLIPWGELTTLPFPAPTKRTVNGSPCEAGT